jgi:hypothetical protein
MYKFMKSLLPTTFDKFYSENREHHLYPTRSSNQLRLPLVKTKLAENFITKVGVRVWNEISMEIEVNTKIGSFKSKLKSHLVGKY